MPTKNSLNSSQLEQHLTEAQTRAEKGDYASAVKAVSEAKTLAPKNIYVLAFEKQVELLSALAAAKSLTDEHRTCARILPLTRRSGGHPGTEIRRGCNKRKKGKGRRAGMAEESVFPARPRVHPQRGVPERPRRDTACVHHRSLELHRQGFREEIRSS